MPQYDPSCGSFHIPPLTRESTYRYPIHEVDAESGLYSHHTPIVHDGTGWLSYCVMPMRSYHISPTHRYIVIHDDTTPPHWSAAA
jgi:hypothetical protein